MRIRPSAARLDVVAGAEAGNTGLPLRLRGLENRTVGERRDGRRHARPAMPIRCRLGMISGVCSRACEKSKRFIKSPVAGRDQLFRRCTEKLAGRDGIDSRVIVERIER
jgi:hypothetical protein